MMGAGPSFRSPLEVLKAFTSAIPVPFVCGIKDDNRPVVSSHEGDDAVVVFDVATKSGISTPLAKKSHCASLTVKL